MFLFLNGLGRLWRQISGRERSSRRKPFEQEVNHHQSSVIPFDSSRQSCYRLYSNARTGYMLLDSTSGDILDINQWLLDHLGIQSAPENIAQLFEFQEGSGDPNWESIHSSESEMIFEAVSLSGQKGWYELTFWYTERYDVIECLAHDISRQKETEGELLRSEELLLLAMEAASEAWFEIRPVEKKTFFSPQWYRMLGYEAFSFPVTQERFMSLIAPEDRAMVQQDAIILLQEGEAYDREIRMIKKDGEIIWTHIRGKNFSWVDGRPGRLIGSQTDISKRKEIELALRESEREKARILGSISESVAYLDTAMNILWVNPAGARTVWKTSDQLVGNHCHDLRQCKGHPCDQCPLTTVFHSGTILSRELEDDNGRFCLVTAHPVLDETGVPVGMVQVGRDITHRKLANRRLEESLREKEQLLTEIHHRVKNNLQLISSILQMQTSRDMSPQARDELILTASRIRTIAAIQEYILRIGTQPEIPFEPFLKKLVTDLLTVHSQIHPVKPEIDTIKFQLNPDHAENLGLLVHELVSVMLKQPLKTGCCFRFSLKPGSLSQILIQLEVTTKEQIDIEELKRSHSWLLVPILQRQLGAEIRIDNLSGLRISLEIPGKNG